MKKISFNGRWIDWWIKDSLRNKNQSKSNFGNAHKNLFVHLIKIKSISYKKQDNKLMDFKYVIWYVFFYNISYDGKEI